MVDAVIFDFDGVLVDTMDLHFKTWQKLAELLGYDLPPELKKSMRGASRFNSLAIVLDHGKVLADDRLKASYADLKDKWFQEELQDASSNIILPGVLTLLESLKQRGIQCAVASSSRNAKNILKKLEIDTCFKIILDANDIDKSKPDPAVFQEAILFLNSKPQNTWIIEDSPLGIQAAKQLGCKTIAVGPHAFGCGADLEVNSMDEINANIFS